MKFKISREELLKPLSLAVGVVESRHTLPILSNVLLRIDASTLTIIGTDAEIEIKSFVNLNTVDEDGAVTVPAKKLFDICKSLPEGNNISFSATDDRVSVTSGKSRFVLAALPAKDFPETNTGQASHTINILAKELRRLIDSTAFAMAQQDVRYFLNGMLWELDAERLRVVATDGHRLAMCDLEQQGLAIDEKQQMIVPHKGIQELSRLLSDEESVQLGFDDAHLRVTTENFVFTSKLIDGKFPDYERVLPKSADKTVSANRQSLKESFSRVAILSNEKFKGVRLAIQSGEMLVTANNPDHEEAEENVQVSYDGQQLEIGFNVKYLIDVFSVLKEEQVTINLSDGNSSALITGTENDDAVYVVMPMRL